MIHRSLSHLILTVGIVGLLAAGSPTTTSATPSSVRQRAALCDVAESDGVVARFASEKLWVPERPLSREIPVTLPGGEYTLRLITSDADHPQNPSQQNERWVLDLLDETGQIVYSSPPTPDLADEDIASDDAVGQLTTYVDVAAVRARHLGTEKATIAGPDSITPLCAVFVPIVHKAGQWIELGPSPVIDSPLVWVQPDNAVAGAVEAIAADPKDVDRIFIATVSGGIWRTLNATDSRPHWEPLTDDLPSLNISALLLNPPSQDCSTGCLYAGTGGFSSGTFTPSGRALGVYRSQDGGDTWELLGPEEFDDPKPGSYDPDHGLRVRSIVSPDDVSIVVATVDHRPGVAQGEQREDSGIWRFEDETWKLLSGTPGTGLPRAEVSHMVADPRDPNVLFAAVAPEISSGWWKSPANGDPTKAGVYRSDDGGNTWRRIWSTPPGLEATRRIELSVSPVSRSVFVSFTRSQLLALFRLGPDGSSPESIPLDGQPLGRQGHVHGSILADRTDADVFYFGGIREVQKIDVSRTPHDWTDAASTRPHNDSRDMAFDAAGNLLEADDGGLYRWNLTGDKKWVSVVGDLGVTEVNSVSYDTLNSVLAVGLQDNGVAISGPILASNATTTSLEWTAMSDSWGDGLEQGAVVEEIDPVSGRVVSVRYLGANVGLWREVYDSSNTRLDDHPVRSKELSERLSFTDRHLPDNKLLALEVNEVDPSRVLAATWHEEKSRQALYESYDRLDTFNDISTFAVRDTKITALVFGGRRAGVANADLVYLGTDKGQLWVRTGPDDSNAPNRGFRVLGNYSFDPETKKARGSNPIDIAVDPNDYDRIYVTDHLSRVWHSWDGGTTWLNLTGDLDAVADGLAHALTATLLNTPTADVLLVGGFGGVYSTSPSRCDDSGCSWTRFGFDLPNARVTDLVHVESVDLLVAATFGRGVWAMPRVSEFAAPLPAPVLLQSTHGGIGNFELAYPASGGGMAHQFRDNDSDAGWTPTFTFGKNCRSACALGTLGLGPVDGVSMIQSNYGNLELVAAAQGRLYSFWRDSSSPFLWHGPEPVTVDGQPIDDVDGAPALVQSTFGDRGNFELVYPSTNGGFTHLYRDNDTGGDHPPWVRSASSVGSDKHIDGVTLIQSNYTNGSADGNLEVIARSANALYAFHRPGGENSWIAAGRIAAASGPISDVAGNPVLIQSTFGDTGNFELVYPSANGGFTHLYRDNDTGGDHPPWIKSITFATQIGHIDGLSMIQSSPALSGSTDGNLEVVARVDNTFVALWRGPDFGWRVGRYPHPAWQPTVALSPGRTVIEDRSGPVQVELTVSLDRPPLEAIEVAYRTRAETADEHDFVPLAGTLTFGPGERTKRLVVEVRPDSIPEGTEQFAVEIGPATVKNFFTSATRAVVTIQDPLVRAPSAPSSLGISISGIKATGTWRAPAHDGGSSVSSYEFQMFTENALRILERTASVSSLSAAHDLIVGEPCRFRVRACNSVGCGAWTAWSAQFTAPGSTTTTSATMTVAGGTTRDGYWMLTSDGRVFAFGDATSLVADISLDLSADETALKIVADSTNGGAWVLTSSGRVIALGGADHHGDMRSVPAAFRAAVVGAYSTLAATPAGDGYWVFTDQGQAVAFGAARAYGDLTTLGITPVGLIVDSVGTPSGNGYWMLGSDGGVFAFGDAEFLGSMGAIQLDQPAVGLVPDPDGVGYWLVASDGGAFAFQAPFNGSVPAVLPPGAQLDQPINGMVPYGSGYLMVASDGGVFAFSDKAFLGSLGNVDLGSPVVGIAALA